MCGRLSARERCDIVLCFFGFANAIKSNASFLQFFTSLPISQSLLEQLWAIATTSIAMLESILTSCRESGGRKRRERLKGKGERRKAD